MGKVNQKKAVEALLELGRKNAGELDADQLVKALKKAPEKYSEKLEAASDATKDLFATIKGYLEQGEELEIKVSKVKENGKPEKKGKGGGGFGKREKDEYGVAKGTISATMNSVLTKKPQTAEKLANAAAVTESKLKSHYAYWIKRGAPITKTEDGKYASAL